MEYFRDGVLGVVQGLTEFLPVSSSGHLVLIPWILRWPYQGLAYDVALHWGTLIALGAVFWRDWLALIKAGLRLDGSQDSRLFWGIFWATLPGATAGLLVDRYVVQATRRPDRVGWLLIVFAVLLWAADRWGRKDRGVEALGIRGCVWIGLAQALALFPGVSRSGITMILFPWRSLPFSWSFGTSSTASVTAMTWPFSRTTPGRSSLSQRFTVPSV